MSASQPEEVLGFWFETLSPAQWWRKSLALDRQVETQFAGLMQQARACELSDWRHTAEGCLAEILILDQFSRHIYRDLPDAFASDSQALVLVQSVLGRGWDQAMSPAHRQFLYMPFMHSESRVIQIQSLALYRQLGNSDALGSAQKHHDIIQRFGRYPHRNAILGRPSTSAEALFLTQPGSGF